MMWRTKQEGQHYFWVTVKPRRLVLSSTNNVWKNKTATMSKTLWFDCPVVDCTCFKPSFLTNNQTHASPLSPYQLGQLPVSNHLPKNIYNLKWSTCSNVQHPEMIVTASTNKPNSESTTLGNRKQLRWPWILYDWPLFILADGIRPSKHQICSRYCWR